MSPERETLLDDIEQSLWTLTEDNLRYLCERCGICGKDGSEVQGKSVRSLHRKIMKEYCENADLTESKGQGTSRLLQLKEDIKGIQEDASGAPTSPSQSATAEVGSSQACCDGEQHEEGGVWFPSRKLEADPVPQWLIIPQQRERVRGQLTRFSVVVHTGESSESSSPHSSQREKSSKKQSHLKRHLHTHSGETSSHCSGSKESLSTVTLSKRPKRVHPKEKFHNCSDCGMSFSSAGCLRKHTLLFHSGEKPFHCLECGEKYTRSDQLKDHMVIHSGVRPYQCPDCKNTFSSSKCLKMHLRTHCADRPFHCSQ
ncbi:unnamed protein product, partial [Coregonus sp. 'balchen']